ncbi:hypothetical protein C1X35_19745 [Pseudomonas sp. FW306-1C-G01A]|uniref:Uncharacterized protein n=2 Tax=root TaxID=1 RepID=A0A6M3M950_9ZZZZ|nr:MULTISPECIES: hypothetical protein [unclassified Pseudomonas]MBU0523481.1 hypothetical protein [Gammaproteobacteria bacterium]PMV90094.1 hypothetical protein C1X51_24720 [Pseudomonas sp. FW306-2-2C-B10A]PMV94176.1 hypothetical protein C1X55_24690 [Pseudomonas sp. GW460-C8]PMW03262.1 hypothetical protein C1X50_23160 [Pseudomonas sp. MPR-TSA4]PMW10872.1 hypothetical protein C1X40_29445 [Pseudomonas sp. GW456-11-11-14-TSB2]PMW16888.1 hypothetical protein C1X53_24260 [Pseudomonas sp. GW456-E6]
MMKKQHGPALVRSLIPMTECPSCAGKGLIKGLLHELDCIGCHSSGFVHAQTLEPLLIEDLVVQLGRMVRRERNQLSSTPGVGGAQGQYEQSNRRGAGGSNYTGD